MKPSEHVGIAITLSTYVLRVITLNLGPDTSYLQCDFLWLSSVMIA
jgi:hypothetical protein